MYILYHIVVKRITDLLYQNKSINEIWRHIHLTVWFIERVLRIRAYHLSKHTFYLVRNESHVDTFSTMIAP